MERRVLPFAPQPRLRYKLIFTPATFEAHGASDRSWAPKMNGIETPVVQEVSLSWFLPNEEVLLREQIVE